MDWNFVGRIWEKWAANNVGTSGQPLKAALLINYDPIGPSRLLSTIAEQEGIVKGDPIEISQFISFVKRNKLQEECFFLGANQLNGRYYPFRKSPFLLLILNTCGFFDLVTSIHENWFSARCMNTSKQAGEGAIVMRTSAFLLVGLYEGSIGSASGAMVAVDLFSYQLVRRNL